MPEIPYRRRGYEDYLTELLGLLARQRAGLAYPLAALDPDDDLEWIVRLSRGWAQLAEIISFYQDRVVNGAFLATATQASLSRIYQSLGHRFQPNLTATTVVSYELTGTAAGIDAVVRAAQLGTASAPAATATSAASAAAAAAARAGTGGVIGMSTQAGPAAADPGQRTTVKPQAQVRALPGPDGRSATYVTDGELAAHLGASQIPLAPAPAPTPAVLGPETTQIELTGTSTGLTVGQPVVIEVRAATDALPRRWIRFLTLVETDTKRKSTRIGWSARLGGQGEPAVPQSPGLVPVVYGFTTATPLFGATAAQFASLSLARRLAVTSTSGAPLVVGGLSHGPVPADWASPRWNVEQPATLPSAWSAVYVEEDLLLAAADQGIYRRKADGVLSASAVSAPVRLVHAFAGSPTTVLLAAAAAGTVYASVDEGNSWSRVLGGPPTVAGDKVTTYQLPAADVRCVAPLNGPTTTIVAGTDAGIYTYSPGVGWMAPTPAPAALQGPVFDLLALDPWLGEGLPTELKGPLSALLGLDPSLGEGWFLAGTADGVEVFALQPSASEISGPKPPLIVEGKTPEGPTGRIYSLAVHVDATKPEFDIWAGGDGQAWVLRISPAGWAWTSTTPVAGAAVNALAITDDGVVVAATSGGVVSSGDVGTTWSSPDVTQLFDVTADPNEPIGVGGIPGWLRAAFADNALVLSRKAYVEEQPLTVVDGDRRYPLLIRPGVPERITVCLAGMAGPASGLALAVMKGGTEAWVTSPQTLAIANEWPGFGVQGDHVELSKPVSGIAAGQLAVVEQRSDPMAPVAVPADVAAVGRSALAEFGLQATVSTLELGSALAPGMFSRRNAMIWTAGAPLQLFPSVAASMIPAGGNSLVLAPDNVPAALPGRLGVVAGQAPGLAVSPLGGLTRVASGRAELAGLSEVAVEALLADGADGVLGAGDAGIFRVSPSGGEPTPLPGGPAVALIAAGSAVLAAFAEGRGVARLDSGGSDPDQWIMIGPDEQPVRALAGSEEACLALGESGTLSVCRDPTAERPAWSALPPPPGGCGRVAMGAGEIFVSTLTGEVFRWQDGRWAATPPVPAATMAAGLAVDAQGTVWLAVNRTLLSLAAGARAWRVAAIGAVGAMRALGTAASGELLLATDDGLYELEPGGPAWIPVLNEPGVDVTALTKARDGALWIGSPRRRSLAVAVGAAGAALVHDRVFAAVPAAAQDVSTLRQGGLPGTVVKAFAEAGEQIDTATALVESRPDGSWAVQCSAALYALVARCGCFDCFRAASVAYPVAAGSGQAWPVTIAGVPGRLAVPPQRLVWLPAAKDAPSFAEPIRLAASLPETGATSAGTPIALTKKLSHVYDPATVVVQLNVTQARQGRPVSRVLGSGDPRTANQRFSTPSPVAMVADSSQSSGSPTVHSTLVVSVDGSVWSEIDSLIAAGPQEHVYSTQPNADGSLVVQFGDGRSGALLPAGRGNVTCRYLEGGGADGEVPSGALVLPLDRPQMVRGVHNPVPGRTPPKPSEHAARDAAVRVLDRVVTLSDIEDVALSQAGVTVASAERLAGPHGNAVAVTLALTADAPADVTERVGAAISEASGGEPTLRVIEAAVIPVTAYVEIRSSAKNAAGAVRAALVGRSASRPGAPLLASDLIAAAVGVAGVDSARIIEWMRTGAHPTTGSELAAGAARWRPGSTASTGRGDVVPAELLTLGTVTVTVSEASP